MTSRNAADAPLSKSQRLALAVVYHLPPVLVRETERVVLNIAVAIVGITSLMAVAEPGTIASVLPLWLLVQWSVTLLLGGTLTLLGMARSWRVVERAGMILSGIGAFTYAAALFKIGGPRAWIVAVLFLSITATSMIRLLASSAANATVNPPQPEVGQ